MAKVYPTLENIQRLKVKPTEGEWFLVNYLVENFSDDVEVYFQPFLNGDMPDTIIMQKNVGVCIIEVKDWDLSAYRVNENNIWELKQNGTTLKSPFQQVFQYKENLFNLHINGLLQERIKNKQFYNRIQPFVYFHKATKKELEHLYEHAVNYYKQEADKSNEAFKFGKIEHLKYEKRIDYLKQKKSKLERDLKYHAIGNDMLQKLSLPMEDKSNLFSESIYDEFQRYLQPPFHTLNQGKEITYTKEQQRLLESTSIREKISGVAGSGKTVLLAKRAVNAHKRHSERVLVMTYNITLRSYIHDKISDVRENFEWGYFYITNYHQFMTQLFNNLGIKIEIPKNMPKEVISQYLEKNYYSNMSILEPFVNEIPKYKSILIDEIQDYEPNWIKIIRDFCLEDDGEMVLLGDPKQNIYHREIQERMPVIVQGFGSWKKLKTSVRYQGDGDRIQNLALSYQKMFFKDKYELDSSDHATYAPSLNLGIYKFSHYNNNQISVIVDKIYQELRDHKIHSNDACILSSNIKLLQEIDYYVRNNQNEKTLTTFETLEMAKALPKEVDNIRKIKKIAFNLNNGLLKIATIHSFKGYEIPNLFLIIDGNDNEEIVYTALTRSKFNIMVFTHHDSKYNNFFEKELEKA